MNQVSHALFQADFALEIHVSKVLSDRFIRRVFDPFLHKFGVPFSCLHHTRYFLYFVPPQARSKVVFRYAHSPCHCI
uniref:Uncharacterized protein n=1 Tax=Cannabis sativa TaxID=3483 RepID=A0A803QZ18_CANSA